MSTNRYRRWIASWAAILLSVTVSSPSIAQDAQSRIEGLLKALPSFESNDLGGGLSCSTDEMSGLATGLDGAFFNVATDLADNLALNVETKSLLGRLSEALAMQGTVLVAVPIPPRGIVQSRHLNGLDKRQRNFDPAYATEDFEKMVADLREAGVVTVDILGAIRQANAWSEFFYLRNNSWTTAGADLAAETVAAELANQAAFADLKKLTFETTAMATVQRKDQMGAAIQQLCHRTVAGETDTAYVTKLVSGDAAAQAPSALVGSTLSADPAFNFGGFLQEKSGLPFTNYAKLADDPVGSLARLVYSEEFADNPPAFIVWELPPGFNLNLAAFTSFRQIIPALYDGCVEEAIVAESDPVAVSGQTSILDLGEEGSVAGSGYYLRLHTSRPIQSKLGLAVTYPNQDADVAVVGELFNAETSNFYLQLADEFDGFVQQVIVTGETAESTVSLTVCRTPEGDRGEE